MFKKISTSISTKLFVITLGLLTTLMITILIFQTLFFQYFYESSKTKSLYKEITNFKTMYSYELDTSTVFTKAMYSFEEKTNAKVGISSLNGQVIHLKENIDDTSFDYKLLSSLATKILNDQEDMHEILDENKTITLKFQDNLSGTTKIGVATAMSLKSKNDCILMAVASIQPIKEATKTINRFYIYIFIGFVFISILISSLYSSLISKPLIRMNNVARKMCNMDFSQKCEIESYDEIGYLANTLNFLSSNLEASLNDLKEKNMKLQEDIDKERQLENMRKDFVASVSHELKTPIGIIEGYAEGLKDGIVSDEKKLLYLETIIDESQKMGKLVANMLELSKLESGVVKPSPEIFNINRLIKKLVSKHQQSALDHNLHLYFKPETEYSYVSADIFQMEQVLTNLITNAIKYTKPDNDIIVSISEKDDIFKISVLNKGSHIDDEQLKHLFDKFYRIDKSRQRNSNSTGLGLAIVKNLLELHGFKYSLYNTDEGVQFDYYTPKCEPDFE